MQRKMFRHPHLWLVLKVTLLLLLSFHIIYPIANYLFESGPRVQVPQWIFKGCGQRHKAEQNVLVENNVTVDMGSTLVNMSIAKVTQITTSSPDKGLGLLKIMAWTFPSINKLRHERLETMRDNMNQDNCFEGCKLTVSSNQSEADEADAIIFFMYNFGFKSKELPTRKRPDQIWIYHQSEPPPYFSPWSSYNNIFNWTMSYRRDSDIYQPYSRIVPLDSPEKSIYFGDHVSLQDWINGKKYLATAVISKCKTDSGREKILKKFDDTGIPFHLYGACGNRTICKRYGENCTDFWGHLAEKYKFFLAFENSYCSEYITEKFWRSLHFGIVPIVYGKGSYVDVAPPHSYIDIRDFSTPEKLNDYLRKLDKNPEEYSKYFEWKKHFSIKYEIANFCEVCTKLKEHRRGFMTATKAYPQQNQFSLPQHANFAKVKVHYNLTGWWRTEPGHPNIPACFHPGKTILNKFFK